MKKIITTLFIFGLLVLTLSLTPQKDPILIKNDIFEVQYSQSLEQPLWLIYKSTNRPTNVNRGAMDFYTEKNIHTSDSKDYKGNEWDKRHLAPAATFSDNLVNLKQTFSYLNCALQHQDLNRGEWRLLEEQERIWDDIESLTVKIDLVFDKNSKKLTTGATVPTYFVKHIYFDESKKWWCFKFENKKPEKKWVEHKISCEH